ncbi:MAG: hypothetical protein ACLQVI_42430 [Polyangiaceae bacterium]
MNARVRVWLASFAVVVLLMCKLTTGCGGTPAGGGSNGGGGAGAEGGEPSLLGGGGPDGGPTGTNNGLVTVLPANSTLVVTGPTTTLAFTATLKGNSSPSTAQWFVDNPSLGSIDGNGLFTASATAGGVLNVTAQIGAQLGSTTLTLHLTVTENPGGLDGGTQAGLTAGGTADSAFRWLYPYDQTVFPQGLTGPTLQWDGTAPDSLLVHVTSNLLDYTGYYTPSGTSQLALPDVLWNAITMSAQASDPVTIQVTKSTAGAVTGPITETWTIAQGSLKGTVYYNTYTSPQANGVGAIMRIQPGGSAEVFIGGSTTGCTVCHTVSANGSTLTASHGTSELLGDYNSGTSYDLTQDAGIIHQQSDSIFSFGALTPDGTILMSNGAMTRTDATNSLDWTPNVPGQTQGPRPSGLYNPRTGAAIAAPGWDGTITYALMPSFSPDAKEIVFNHYDTGTGHSLAVMQFDETSETFSSLVDVATNATSFLGWPSFTPDGASVLFETDSREDYATWQAATGDLSVVDVASKTVTVLDELNGSSGGTIYLPYGASEAHLNFEPTILPVAVGGYYWVVFTSLREYGNTITDPLAQDLLTDRRKLWVSALNIPGPGGSTAGQDVSHPAFYLPGQELAAGNLRGFWALNPCQQNAATCTAGADCCSGFCRPSAGGALTCVPAPSGCSQEYEKCTQDSDCCGNTQGYFCVNGFCSEPPPK